MRRSYAFSLKASPRATILTPLAELRTFSQAPRAAAAAADQADLDLVAAGGVGVEGAAGRQDGAGRGGRFQEAAAGRGQVGVHEK